MDRAKEAALRTNLRMLREAIDKHQADTGRLPTNLEDLVKLRYLRAVPSDPLTERTDTWVLLPVPDGSLEGVHDVRSGAASAARDGTPYASW